MIIKYDNHKLVVFLKFFLLLLFLIFTLDLTGLLALTGATYFFLCIGVLDYFLAPPL